MQLVLLTVLIVAACASVAGESVVGFHERFAIPTATKIKAAEEAMVANQNPNGRIVGGVVSPVGEHPYAAGLIISYMDHPGIGVCGAALVSNSRLLTAAHCWYDKKQQASRFVVVMGSNMLFSGGHRVPTSKVVIYPEWNPTTSQNNMAVIYLPTPVLLTKTIQPIAIATNSSESFVGDWAVAVGFGRTSDKQTSVPVLTVLSEVRAQVITVEQCRKVFGARAQPNTICTNGTGGVGICYGDGGGPLVMNRGGERILIGINTFVVTNACEQGYPSGYARVTSFYDFIMEHLN